MVSTSVLQAIALIVAKGNPVSMAAVKSKVSGRASMREIIETLQAYKANPELINDLPTSPQQSSPADEPSLTMRVEQLEQQIQTQQQLIENLSERLQQLESQ